MVTVHLLPSGAYPTRLCVLFNGLCLGYDTDPRSGKPRRIPAQKERCKMKHTKKIGALSLAAALSLPTGSPA